MQSLLLVLVTAVLMLGAGSARADEDIMMKAMRDELSRSIQKLQLGALSRPYFISYLVRDATTTEASATFGSLSSSNEHRTRTLAVMVRVGDYSLDNTNFVSMRFGFGRMGMVRMSAGGVPLPLEDDYKEIRRQIWLATDAAYKNALEDLSGKRAALQVQTRGEDIPDFTREEPTTITDAMPPARVDRAEAEALVRDLSALFRQMPDIFASSIHVEGINNSIRYVNSEGSSFTRLEPGVMLTATARSQAGDGMPLEDFVAAYGRSMRDLPKTELADRIRQMGARLKQLHEAPLVDEYSGPVLVQGQAAAELFSRVFAPRLLAVRRPISDNPQLGMFFSQQAETFVGRMGSRILPAFLNVVDNPTLDQYDRVRLVGGYKVDDEGVRARETRLVEKGILKTLLASRDPVSGVTHSTGNNQGGLGPMPSNLIVSTEKGLSSEEMKAELLRLVKERGKEYGIIVSRASNPLLLPSPNQMMAMFLPPGYARRARRKRHPRR